MKNCIGIRKEDKDTTERRAPLAPHQVKTLIEKYSIKVLVEPAPNRIYEDSEYQIAGAILSDDLSECNIIFGVKEIPSHNFLPKHTYCFFSHTIKGQSYNMPMLKRMLDLRDTLLDYEKVEDAEGRRLIFFGPFAGYAGMIDSLWALGQRLKWEGLNTAFSEIRHAIHYDSLQQAKQAIHKVGEKIKSDGVPHELVPMICGFAGYGQVSRGAQEIFDELPTEELSPSDLDNFMKAGNYSDKKFYKVVFKESDIVKPRNNTEPFDLQDYYQSPEKYEGVFEHYLPYLTMLINGIYWDTRYPRLATKDYLKSLYQKNIGKHLRVVGDITCDIEGSIEFNVKATNSRNPVYVYEPLTEQVKDGIEGNGPVILAVDKLPTELPREATEFFGESLLPFVPELANADFSVPYKNLVIPREFQGAVIAHDGRLTENYKYLEEYLRQSFK